MSLLQYSYHIRNAMMGSSFFSISTLLIESIFLDQFAIVFMGLELNVEGYGEDF